MVYCCITVWYRCSNVVLVRVLDTSPSGCLHSPPLHTTMFPCIALAMPFSRDSLTKLSVTRAFEWGQEFAGPFGLPTPW